MDDMKTLEYVVLVGQFLGELQVLDEKGQPESVAAVRRGFHLLQHHPRLSQILRECQVTTRTQDILSAVPGSDLDLERLVDSGDVLTFSATGSLTLATADFRLTPSGVSGGLDESTATFRIRGTLGNEIEVDEKVFWVWVYSSTCPSIDKTCELVANLVPNTSSDEVRISVLSALPALLRNGCIQVDSALVID